jgi:hypothetical protein
MIPMSARIMPAGLLVLMMWFGVGPGAATTASAAVTLPQAYVDTTYPQQNGNRRCPGRC